MQQSYISTSCSSMTDPIFASEQEHQQLPKPLPCVSSVAPQLSQIVIQFSLSGAIMTLPHPVLPSCFLLHTPLFCALSKRISSYRSCSRVRQRIHFLIVFRTDASLKVSNQMCRISNPFATINQRNFPLSDTNVRQYFFAPYNNHKSTSLPRCCSTHLHCGTFAARGYCLVHWSQLPRVFLILPVCISSHILGLCTTEWLIADMANAKKSLSCRLLSNIQFSSASSLHF